MKKPLFLLLTLALLPLQLPVASRNAFADEPVKVEIPAGNGAIRVTVAGLRNTDGNLSVALFNVKKGFPGKYEKALRKIDVPAAGAEHVVVFDNVPYGLYAVAVRHDENGNGKLDTNILGMPKEGVGTSNNPKSRFGPPSFEDASFTLDKSTMELTVNLRYL
jgi:uncharacterized protein (DUF2141 family)